MSAQQVGSLASAAGNAAAGNYVSAAVNLVQGLFGGGGKTPAMLQGFNVSGTFGRSGFEGAVTAFDQKGDRWDATHNGGGQLYEAGRSLATYGGLSEADIQSYFDEGGAPIPIDLTVAGDGSAIRSSVGSIVAQRVRASSGVNALLNQLTGRNMADMQAPEITGATPPGTPVSGAGASSAAAVAAPAQVAGSLFEIISQNQLLAAIVAGLILYWITRGKAKG